MLIYSMKFSNFNKINQYNVWICLQLSLDLFVRRVECEFVSMLSPFISYITSDMINVSHLLAMEKLPYQNLTMLRICMVDDDLVDLQ